MSYDPINWDEDTPITATLLDRMDTGINENDDDLATIQGEEAEVDGRISNNENNINTNENDISTNENNIASNEDRISTNENDISDLQNINNINQSAEITKTVSGNSIEDFTLTGIFVIRLKGTDLNLKVNGKIVVSQRNIPYFVFSSGNNITIENTTTISSDYFYREITFN